MSVHARLLLFSLMQELASTLDGHACMESRLFNAPVPSLPALTASGKQGRHASHRTSSLSPSTHHDHLPVLLVRHLPCHVPGKAMLSRHGAHHSKLGEAHWDAAPAKHGKRRSLQAWAVGRRAGPW